MGDSRWKIGKTLLLPPATNANFAWILYFLYHLAPKGHAGFVLANGADYEVRDGKFLEYGQ